MTDIIRVNESDNIIEVISSGVLTRQDMESATTRFRQILAEKGIDRVFIDTTRLESIPAMHDIFKVFTTLPPGLKIAILVAPSSTFIKDVAFAETVGGNRGDTIKVCLDENEARQWLGVTNA
jgi:hypothetical protein